MNLGVLLPCNVVDEDGDVVVSAVDPERVLSIVDNPALDEIAADVADRFDRVIDSLGTVDGVTA